MYFDTTRDKKKNHPTQLIKLLNERYKTLNPEAMENYYGTLSETINGLIKEGYTIDFNLESGIALSPDDFEIDSVYRFEGATNPDDQSILYAISARKSEIKGTLVNGYGISSVGETDELLSRLKTHDLYIEE